MVMSNAPAAQPPRRNFRADTCSVCRAPVAAMAGYLYREGARWTVKCPACAGIVAVPSTIRITLDGPQLMIQTVGARLESDKFNAYRKAIEGAKWDGTRSANFATLDKGAGIVRRLHEAGFLVDLDPAVAEAVHGAVDANRAAVASAVLNADAVDAILKAKGLSLFSFQRVGSTWLSSRYRALLADEMGLGKTLQTLVALPAGARAVVVAPAVVKGVWNREVARWRPDLSPTVLTGRGSFRWPERDGEIVITNYDILRSEVEEMVPMVERSASTETSAVRAVEEGDTLGLAQDLPDGLFAVRRQGKKDGRWTTLTVHTHFEDALRRYRDETLYPGSKTAPRALAIGLTGSDRVLVHSKPTTTLPADPKDIASYKCELTVEQASAIQNGLRALCNWTRRHYPQVQNAQPRDGFSIVIEGSRGGGGGAEGSFSPLARWDEKSRLSLDAETRRVSVPRGVTHVRVQWTVTGSKPQTFGVGFKPRRAWSDPPAGTILIGDEAHMIKNAQAERTILFRALSADVCGSKGRCWLLTATPLLNSPPELWSVLQAAGIAQEAFGSWPQFTRLFGGSQDRWGGWTWGDVSAEVPERLQRVCLRRIRSQVLPELPTKMYQPISVDLDASVRKLCDAAVASLLANGVDIRGDVTAAQLKRFDAPSFDEISAARAALASAKIAAMVELVESYEEQEEAVVVFSAHRAPIDLLAKRPGWAVITGDTPNEERTAIEEKFQRGELKGVGATMQAGGVGITLTRACHALFVDRAWTPALNKQAEDRICRIGQDRGCLIRVLTADHALDERVNELLEEKDAIINASVEASSRTDAPVIETSVGVDMAQLAAEAKARMEEADKARVEAERIAAERAAAAETLKIENEKNEKERKTREHRAKLYEKARERARGRGWVVADEDPTRRGPQTEREVWAARALTMLSDLDPDFAKDENGVGFNKADGSQGHFLGLELAKGLTTEQWSMAIVLCRKYHGQVGECPPAATGDAENHDASSSDAADATAQT
jgi:hypothetical protein